jgi:hypothetical protein
VFVSVEERMYKRDGIKKKNGEPEMCSLIPEEKTLVTFRHTYCRRLVGRLRRRRTPGGMERWEVSLQQGLLLCG